MVERVIPNQGLSEKTYESVTIQLVFTGIFVPEPFMVETQPSENKEQCRKNEQ